MTIKKCDETTYLKKRSIIWFVILIISIAVLFVIPNQSLSSEHNNKRQSNIKNFTVNGYTFNDREQAVLKTLIIQDMNTYLLGKINGNGSETIFGPYWDEITKNLVFVTADELQALDQNNGAEVDKKYYGKSLFLSGIISSINRGEDNNYFITFSDDKNATIKAKAYMSSGQNADHTTNLNIGEKIGIICRGDGMVDGFATANNCMPVSNLFEKNEGEIINLFEKPPHKNNKIRFATWVIVTAETAPEFGSCLNAGIFKYNDCLARFNKKREQTDEKARARAINNAARKLRINSAKLKKELQPKISDDKTANKDSSSVKKSNKAESSARIRMQAAEEIGNEFYKALNSKPIITLSGKDKSILILESIRFDSEFVWQITLNNRNIPFCSNVYAIIVNAQFKKVYFIKQRYNANEFAGEIWDVEQRCLEGDRVGYCGYATIRPRD